MNDKPDKDIYDQAVEYFTQHPEKIQEAWNLGSTSVQAEGNIADEDEAKYAVALFGNVPGEQLCLTQIHSQDYAVRNRPLRDAIQADSRIPDRGDGITTENFPVFAEWQRKLHQPATKE